MEISNIFGGDSAVQSQAPRKDDKQDSKSFQEIMNGCTENTDARNTGKTGEAAEASSADTPAETSKNTDTEKSAKADTASKETEKTDAEGENQTALSGIIPSIAPVLDNNIKTEDTAKSDGKAVEAAAEGASSIPEATLQAAVVASRMATPASLPAQVNEASAPKADTANAVASEASAVKTVISAVSDKTSQTQNNIETDSKTSPDEPVVKTESKEVSLPEALSTDAGIKTTENGLTAQPEVKPAVGSNNAVAQNAGNMEIPKEFKADTKETSDPGIKAEGAVKTEEPKSEKAAGFKATAKEIETNAGQTKNADDTAKATAAVAVAFGTDSGSDFDSADTGESDRDANAIDNVTNVKADGVVSASADKFSVETAEPAKEEISVHKTEVYGKLEGGIKASIAKSGKEVSLSLNPEHLGQMRIKLNIEDNVVTAKIVVDNAAVKGMLDSDAGRLKEVFGAQGLTLDKYTIELNPQTQFGPSDLGGNQAGMSRDGACNQNAWRNFVRNTEDQNGGIQYPQEFRESGNNRNSGIDLFA